MLVIMTGEASKEYKKKKVRDRIIKNDKYSLMQRFHHYRWIQFYVYDFMYVDPDTMSEEDYFPATLFF